MTLIGKYELIDSEYHEYDNHCSVAFRKIKKIIMSQIPQLKVEHTGSSAIGIGGKNIIDILVICNDLNYNPILEKLEKIGFQVSPFKNIPKERPIRVGSIICKNKKYLIHIHVTYSGSQDNKNILFLRDYLKDHKELAKEYEQIKKKAVESGKVEATEYNEQKSDFIQSILSKMK